jgi:predicted secreted hydrolase
MARDLRKLRVYLLFLIALWPTILSYAETARVAPGYTIQFPQDEGSHPDFRTEWWYLTGWLSLPDGAPVGFQVTFFRVRPDRVADHNPSSFTPRQILFAHAALSDPRAGSLTHGEKIARSGFGLAQAQRGKTDVWIDDWSLKQDGNRYAARIAAPKFHLDLSFERVDPPLLHGESGYVQRALDARVASYYYSFPQLKVGGRIERGGNTKTVSGIAWLDHEWSNNYLDRDALGWDWTGINLDDGAALMAFRMRGRSGAIIWSAGTLRTADGKTRAFNGSEITFTPRRHWRSPRTNAIYPVAFEIRAGELDLTLDPLLDDQELDSRQATRQVYWEGAVRALRGGRQIGKGYLELTGYARELRM